LSWELLTSFPPQIARPARILKGDEVMDEKEFYDGQRPADEGGRFWAQHKEEDNKGCGCALVVLALLVLAIAGIIWLVTGTK
jgi:hypothetical protein